MVSVNEFEHEAKEAAKSPWARRLARFGLVAKGIMFGIVAVVALEVAFGGETGGKIGGARAAVLLVRAAYQYDPKEAIGLDGALRKVADAQYGIVSLRLVAAGLFAYGLFSLVQARYREV